MVRLGSILSHGDNYRIAASGLVGADDGMLAFLQRPEDSLLRRALLEKAIVHKPEKVSCAVGCMEEYLLGLGVGIVPEIGLAAGG